MQKKREGVLETRKKASVMTDSKLPHKFRLWESVENIFRVIIAGPATTLPIFNI